MPEANATGADSKPESPPESTPKSTPEEIRARFDADVERFSNLETGQSATIDAPLVLDLIAHAAAAVTPAARHIVDVGCGAGNYTLKLLQHLRPSQATLIDLSGPMLDRAVGRISATSAITLRPIQGDIRSIDLGVEQADVIVAAAVLHHLRTADRFYLWQFGGMFRTAIALHHAENGHQRRPFRTARRPMDPTSSLARMPVLTAPKFARDIEH